MDPPARAARSEGKDTDGELMRRELIATGENTPRHWRNIPISLIDRVLSVNAWLLHLTGDLHAPSSILGNSWNGYCSFAYSALASFRMGMSGSASFQRVRKS
jgi:hypothetical protein